MSKFTNSPTTQEKSGKTFRGGEQIDPARIEQLVSDFKNLDKEFVDFKENLNEFKSDTKDSMKSQTAWVTGGFIALLFIVIGLLIAVGAMAGDYWSNKTASYQELNKSVMENNFKVDTLINKIHCLQATSTDC